jgi:hypothetical protein
MPSANALRIHAELVRLARRHNVTWPQPAPAVPPLPECSDYVVHMAGIASDSSIDNARLRFAPHALLWTETRLPELRYRHLPGAIGHVLDLQERPDGVHAMISTTDKRAMLCPALSVGVTIREWEIAEEHNANFHVIVKSAVLDEISTVQNPCNPHCLIRSRTPGSALTQTYDLATHALALVGQLVQLQSQTVTREGSPSCSV